MYKRAFAAFYDRYEQREHVATAPVRRKLLAGLEGEVLELGAGTGANFPYYPPSARVTATDYSGHMLRRAEGDYFADLNPNCLERTSRRIRRHAPVTHVWNAFEPFGDAAPRFGSIGLSNFLHCLPGSMLEKEPVIRNLRPLLREGGVLFGSTVLGRGVDHVGALYRATNRAYNRKSIFCNADDGAAELERILAGSFARQSVRIAGAMALFTAHA